ncbi:CRISPR-associated protein GSU0054/csb2, Dpsyc system [Actinomyces bovis]|uniref:CRISPR-associated protein GSU0054/csb2, Dpsyc system n=1 Tax=Actinomyces bovis TaxID=1658 RepID=A0ABY1VQS6_9ACTO|nr:type I-U CRISPR-associated protein Csb2 [Actinomyces bovis]SPT55026.1 CRISPR-associated protein GSU0054/csb2, Dpsyc system [Actinomyces bovis]VEG56172.1 CRISPR-associated protein GSU0054/csb2, Dpsyc system [Actinomyces israelii]
MTSVGITARFPLGVYHGHAADGSADSFPTPLRLFSALVNSAYTGTTTGPDGALSAATLEALNWLENNPPRGLYLPPSSPVNPSQTSRVAYRKTGTIEKKQPKIAPKMISDGIALAGKFGWIWEEMPDSVREILARLCEDVPCLGEMDSPVVLEVSKAEPNWTWLPEATAFTPGGRRVPVPAVGRRAVLEALHQDSRPRKAPTESADRLGETSDAVRPFPVSIECTRVLHYAPRGLERPSMGSPWSDVLVFRTEAGAGVLPAEQRLDWCVGFHRALVSRIGDGTPSVITGRYPTDRSVPANRVAIQYLPESLLSLSNIKLDHPAPGVFLVMIPSDISTDDLNVLIAALAGMTYVTSRWGRLRLRRHDELVLTSEFWHAPAAGAVRLWSPTPVAVPEVTRQKGPWTFEDAILLSLGFVWRDRLEPVGKGTQGYRSLVKQVRERGAGVSWYRRTVKSPSSYAHRMPEGMVAQPYTAVLSSGELTGNQELVAIGQSRHLGGGLLAPVDLPAELAESLKR